MTKQLTGFECTNISNAATDDIYADYEIRDKVVTTATDNGSNFIHAFVNCANNASANEVELHPQTSACIDGSEQSDVNNNRDNDFKSSTGSTIY